MPISPLVHAKEWIHRAVDIEVQGHFSDTKCNKTSDSWKASEYNIILLIEKGKCQAASTASQMSTQRMDGSKNVLEIERIMYKWAELDKDKSNLMCTEVILVKEETANKRIF